MLLQKKRKQSELVTRVSHGDGKGEREPPREPLQTTVLLASSEKEGRPVPYLQGG